MASLTSGSPGRRHADLVAPFCIGGQGAASRHLLLTRELVASTGSRPTDRLVATEQLRSWAASLCELAERFGGEGVGGVGELEGELRGGDVKRGVEGGEQAEERVSTPIEATDRDWSGVRLVAVFA